MKKLKIACIGNCTLLIFGIIGLILLTTLSNPKNQVKAECTITDCRVNNITCSHEQCTGTTNNKQCTTIYDTCWAATTYFFLNKDVRTTEKFDFTTFSGALARCDSYKINSTIPCYYDKEKDPAETLTLVHNGRSSGTTAGIVIFSIAITISSIIILLIVVVEVCGAAIGARR